MRFLAVASAGLVALINIAAAQDLSSLPACAQSCAINAIGSTGCSLTDVHCICTATGFLSGVATCIQTACSAADQAATLQFAQSYCLSASVTITIPSASASAPPASSSAAPASTPAMTSSEMVAPATTSVAPSASTYTGAAHMLKQDWAGVLGAVGLGVAAVL